MTKIRNIFITMLAIVVTMVAFGVGILNTQAAPNEFSIITQSHGSVTQSTVVFQGVWIGDNVETWFEYSDNIGELLSRDGYQTASVYRGSSFFAQNIVQHVSGLQPATRYYYMLCATGGSNSYEQCHPHAAFITLAAPNNTGGGGGEPGCTTNCGGNDDINVITLSPTNIDEDSAKLRGEIRDGNNIDVWFVISRTDSTPSCSDNDIREDVSGLYDQDEDFDKTVTGLREDTRYYYRACGEAQDGTEDDGAIESFRTDSDGGNGGDDEPDVSTRSATNIDEDDEEATLRGEYDMNDYDGHVFFAWIDDDRFEDELDDVDNEDEIENIDNDVNIEDVDHNADAGDRDDDVRETISNLDTDEEHFFRLCVEYSEGIKCGSVQSFEFDDNDNDNDDFEVETDNATNVQETSATLNGEYRDADDADIFFVWGRDRDDIEDIEDENEIDDIRDDSQFDDVDIEVVERGADGDDRSVDERVSGLRKNTRYYFRLCGEQDRDLECGIVRSFTTDEEEKEDKADAEICRATNIGISSATLTSDFKSDSSARAYFAFGTTGNFGQNTSVRSYNSGNRDVSHLASGLAANTTYFCQLVVENDGGESRGPVGSFRTRALPAVIIPRAPVTTVVQTRPSSGPGALVLLEIDDEQDIAARGQILQYDVTWVNISKTTLDEVALFIQLPKATRFLSTDEGSYNRGDHAVYVPLGELDPDDEGEMTITVRVGIARDGEPIVAEAIMAFENPEQGGAYLSVIELDADIYNFNGANLAAGLFNLEMPTTLIGWALLILVFLLLIFGLRYLYLAAFHRRRRRHNTPSGPGGPVGPYS